MNTQPAGGSIAPFDVSTIHAARERIAPFIKRTPLEKSESLTSLFGFDVYVKYELFQKTGSFKPRGAFNKLLNLTENERSLGVVAVSGGNHAQAVAYAAAALGTKAVILMPENTPQIYLDAARGYGATIDLQPTIAEAFSRIDHYVVQGLTLVHPFDDPLVIAGQGTVGLEIMDDVPAATDIVVSIGGGGLACGVAAAVKSIRPSIRVWGVETEGADAMAQALAAGHPVELPAITSIAKTLGAPAVTDSTLMLAQHLLESVTVVPDSEAVAAMVFILERLKVITEPAASCTLAAAGRLKENFDPETKLVLVFCGGNTGTNDLCGYLAGT
ncbi:MAG: threonine/serine dehydratase [Pyrinomonadaceae bacterium]